MDPISNEHHSWRLPAEWETQEFVQLTWPHEDTDWQPILPQITATYVQMAVEIARRERLVIVSPRPEEAIEAIGMVAEKTILDNITTFACPTDDTWARDHAFISLTDGSRRRLLDFRFNGWGDKFEAEKDNAINRRLYEAGMVEGEYADHNEFVLEGGSIESDGRGTVFTTTGCLLAPNRNQPMTQQEIDSYLRKTLCADRIIWINNGNLTGDDTDGHIDTLVRIAPNDTLLYVGCDDPTDEQYGELHAMEQQLRSLATTDGHPYRLLKLPMPRPIYHDGERLPATYANFLAINGAILYPTYAQDDLDDEAASIMREAFPGLEVVGIDCRSVIMQHGSLHCCTMQYPSAGHGDDAAGTL